MAAAHALARGLDSPALRELAGLSPDLFHQAMDELATPVPDENGARLYLIREAAATIVAGRGDPEDLALEIDWSLEQMSSHSNMPTSRDHRNVGSGARPRSRYGESPWSALSADRGTSGTSG